MPKRIVATESERRKLIRAGRKLGIKLRDLITIVNYYTFCRWILAIRNFPIQAATEFWYRAVYR